MTDLPALLSRIEAGSGPDRELDALVEAWAYELDSDARADIVCDSDNVECGHYWVSIDSGRTLYSSAPLTTSLDACRALGKRLNPQAGYRLDWRPWGETNRAWATWGNKGEQEEAYGSDEPRALLAAIVKARMSENE